MESNITKIKEVEYLQEMHTIQEMNEEPTTPIEPSQALFVIQTFSYIFMLKDESHQTDPRKKKKSKYRSKGIRGREEMKIF